MMSKGSNRKLFAAVISTMALIGGGLLFPSSAMAAPLCSVSITSIGVSSNEAGKWVTAAAYVSCNSVPELNYTTATLSLVDTSTGQYLTLEYNAGNENWGTFQSRKCEWSTTCTIYVSGRATADVRTYQAWAGGYITGPAHEWDEPANAVAYTTG